MKLNNQKGFTLIELVLVITILGILAVAALPSFIDITTDAATASRDGVVGAIREGLAIQYADSLVNNPTNPSYPATLDGQADATAASDSAPLFTNVLDQGVNSRWTKTDSTNYVYDPDGLATCYEYTPADGTFLVITCPE